MNAQTHNVDNAPKPAVSVLARWLREIPVAAIRLYRRLRPQRVIGHCIHTPVCTEYSMEALRRHGIVRGLLLSIKRLSRCNGKWHDGGHDPVP